MMQGTVKRLLLGALVTHVAFIPPVLAQTPGPAAPVERQATPDPAQLALTQDARETREKFEVLLRRLPPTVGRVLRLDPSLMRNQVYLTPYPALSAFLQQYPDILNNPGFYLENVRYELWNPPTPIDRDTETIRLWRETIQGFSVFIVFLMVSGGVLWIVKSILDWRRWTRATKVQAEVHNKLLDRFTANEDLLKYIQTPVGQRFLDSTPVTLETTPSQPVGAPVSRILWSLQAGFVLAAAGAGLLFVSGRVIEQVSQVLFAVGVLVLTVGVGFAISAAASFLLSQRLGLLPGSGVREHSDPTRI